MFLRVDSNRIDVMQVIIVGPTGTPYANGCFLFDIYCPPEYPKAPPLVNLQVCELYPVHNHSRQPEAVPFDSILIFTIVEKFVFPY